jgi:hypothetical protein
MKAWLQLISIGCLGGLIATSCVITSDDDDDPDDNGDAGETSTGGRSTTGGRASTGGRAAGGSTNTGGKSMAGSPGTGGSVSTGGSSASGGTLSEGGEGGGGEPVNSCTVDSTPADGCDIADPDACDTCMMQECCDEYAACDGSNPTDVCIEEFPCVFGCLLEVSEAGEVPGDTDLDACLAMEEGCLECPDNAAPSPNTGNLAACVVDNCSDECFPVD